jgi:hypothetical protein
LPHPKAMNLLREPDAGNPHVRFDEREVETERLASQRHLSTPPFSTSVPFSTFPFSTFQSCPGFGNQSRQQNICIEDQSKKIGRQAYLFLRRLP